MTEWHVLARGEHGVDVARCPEGHIDVELERRGLALRFNDADFLAFAHTVAAAAAAIGGRDWAMAVETWRDGHRLRN